jgi:hypothetical protein
LRNGKLKQGYITTIASCIDIIADCDDVIFMPNKGSILEKIYNKNHIFVAKLLE